MYLLRNEGWFLTQLWRDLADLPEEDYYPKRLPDLTVLQQLQWSPIFELLMRNRLIMGGIRYTTFVENRNRKWQYAEEIKARVCLYESTGNLEHLVDAANYCLLEFEFGNHPKKHWVSTDDGHHCQEL